MIWHCKICRKPSSEIKQGRLNIIWCKHFGVAIIKEKEDAHVRESQIKEQSAVHV